MKKAAVEIVGIEDVEKILNQLPGKFQAPILNAALKEVSIPLFEKAKQNLGSVPFSGQTLVKVLRQKLARERGLPGVEIGAMPMKRKRRNDGAWEDMGAYWTEFGTMELMTIQRSNRTRSLAAAQRRVGKPPSTRGRIPAYAWLRNAVDTTDKQMQEDFRNYLWKHLNKSLLRKAKKIKWSGLQ